MMVIGLTGGIGMGKSTVAGMFARCGVPGFDADACVHALQAPGGAALPVIERAFPGTVTDGVLSRARLRDVVLADDAAMWRLEQIIHPMVRRAEAAFRASRLRAGARAVLLDIPLLFETGGERRVDVVVVVSAPRDVQMARCARRRGMSEAQIAAVIAKQVPDAEKRERADFVIYTGLAKGFAMRGVRRVMRELGL